MQTVLCWLVPILRCFFIQTSFPLVFVCKLIFVVVAVVFIEKLIISSLCFELSSDGEECEWDTQAVCVCVFEKEKERKPENHRINVENYSFIWSYNNSAMNMTLQRVQCTCMYNVCASCPTISDEIFVKEGVTITTIPTPPPSLFSNGVSSDEYEKET